MNKPNLKKTLAAGIFAVAIISITAILSYSFRNFDSESIKITTIAGGGASTTATDPTQATLDYFYNIVASGDSLLYISNRGELGRVNLATNQLSTETYSGIGSDEYPDILLATSATKHYFLTYKDLGSDRVFALYEANSDLVATHIAGKNDAPSGLVDNDNGLLASLVADSASLYNDGANEHLFFTDHYKIRKVTLSGSYPVSSVNANSPYQAANMAIKGQKLIVADYNNFLIFEHDLKTGLEKIIAGGLKDASGDYLSGYENAENPLQAKLLFPFIIAISPSGNIYFTVQGVDFSPKFHEMLDGNQRIIRKLEASKGVYGAVTTAFGSAPGSKLDNDDLFGIIDLDFVGNNLYAFDDGADGILRIKKIEFINQTP